MLEFLLDMCFYNEVSYLDVCKAGCSSFLCDPTDHDLIKCLVSESLVPKNAGTSTFHEMIESLTLVESQEALDCLLDKREYMERINSSQWDITEPLTIERKEKLIKELVFDELVEKG